MIRKKSLGNLVVRGAGQQNASNTWPNFHSAPLTAPASGANLAALTATLEVALPAKPKAKTAEPRYTLEEVEDGFEIRSEAGTISVGRLGEGQKRGCGWIGHANCPAVHDTPDRIPR
jgi:hypothetical protein